MVPKIFQLVVETFGHLTWFSICNNLFLFRSMVPKIFYVTEKAWNYYPFTITEYSVSVSVCLSAWLSVRISVFCLSVFLSVCLSVCLSFLLVYLFVCLSVCPSICQSEFLSVHLSGCSSICLSACLSTCLTEKAWNYYPFTITECSVSKFVRLSVYVSLSIYLSFPVKLSACLSVHLSGCPSVCLRVSLSIYLSFPFNLSVCLSVYLSECKFLYKCLTCFSELANKTIPPSPPPLYDLTPFHPWPNGGTYWPIIWGLFTIFP